MGKRGFKVVDGCLWNKGRWRSCQSGSDGGAEYETGWCWSRDRKGELDEVVDPLNVLFFEAANA